MKRIFVLQKYLSKRFFILFVPFYAVIASGQVVPELVFQNPVLESGTNNQDGAKYRFSNVSPGYDAVLEIVGRSSASVVVNTVDKTGVGWGKALQPELGKTGIIPPHENWWVEFRIRFYNASTSIPSSITSFNVTGLDIDGDGSKLNEWAEMYRVDGLTLSPATSLVDNILSVVLDPLNPNNNGQDHQILGPTANFKDIDTAGTAVMATYTYLNKNEIRFKLGGSTGSGSSSAGMRMNSLWFKDFDLSAHTLPVQLYSFTATLNKEWADLKWTTASEVNVSHFVVEKSTDGKNYTEAALVFAHGNSTEKKDYLYKDDVRNSSSGVIYYRLRMHDKDGSFTYSNVRMIRKGDQNKPDTILIYPNPAESELKITIPSDWQAKDLQIELFNASGQRVKAIKTTNASQTEIIDINKLEKGVYILKATNGTRVASQKFIKN